MMTMRVKQVQEQPFDELTSLFPSVWMKVKVNLLS